MRGLANGVNDHRGGQKSKDIELDEVEAYDSVCRHGLNIKRQLRWQLYKSIERVGSVMLRKRS